MKTYRKGFTLVELIITVIVLGIVIAVATASYDGLIANQALKQRTDQLYYVLQLAKSEALKRNQKIYVHFCQQGNAWSMGVTDLDSCDCFTANSCVLDGVEKVQELVDGDTLFINSGDLTFTGDQASYSPLRFSVASGAVTLSNSEGKSLSVIQSSARLRICAPGESQLGYPQC